MAKIPFRLSGPNPAAGKRTKAADRRRIAAALATHPHPNPADRNTQARARAYEARISNIICAGREAAGATQEQAAAAMAKRGRLTRALPAVGITTHEHRNAEHMMQHAMALTDAAGRAVSRDDYAHARATGRLTHMPHGSPRGHGKPARP